MRTTANVIDATLRFVDKFTSPFRSAVQKAEQNSRRFNSMARDMKKAGKSITQVGTNLTAKLTLPIVGLGTAAGKMASDFQDSIANINTLIDDTSHLDSYKKSVYDVSDKYGIALNTVSDGMYQTVSAIGDLGGKTRDIFDTCAKAGKAGGASTKESVDMITSTMKAYNSVNNETAGKISDLAFLTQKLGVTTFAEMAKSMQGCTPLASSLSVNMEDLYGSMATLTGVTGNTAEVSTQLKGIYTSLMKPSKGMSEFMKKYGYESGEAMIKARGFKGVLGLVKKETGGSSTELSKLFKNSKALTGMVALTGSQYENFCEKSKKMYDSTGTTNEAFEKLRTKGSKLRNAINRIKNSTVKLGETLLGMLEPAIISVSDKITKLTEKFNGMSEKQKQTIIKTLGMIAVVGPTLIIVGKIVSVVGAIIQFVAQFGLMIKFIRTGASVFKIFGACGSVVTLGVVAGIVAVIGVIVLLIKNWDKVKNVAGKVGNYIRKTFLKMGVDTKKISRTFGTIGKAFGIAFNAIKDAAPTILKVLETIGKFVVGVFLFNIKWTVGMITSIVAGVVQNITNIVSDIVNIFNGVIDFFTGAFTGNWKKAFGGLADIVKGAFGLVVDFVKAPLNAVISLVNGAISGINSISINIPKWVPGIGGKHFGASIPSIPLLYRGTSNWKGGLAEINEPRMGGEIVDLPDGSRVIPHDKSLNVAFNAGKKESKGSSVSNVYNITINATGSIKEQAEELCKMLMDALSNAEPAYE